MKPLLLLTLAAAMTGCMTQREVQADMIDAKLVQVDMVNRYPESPQKMLRWRTTDNVDYITFEPASVNVPIGAIMKVLVKK